MRTTIALILFFVAPVLADESIQPVWIESEGSTIHFGSPPEYTSTGFSVTPEASQYQEAIKKLITEELDFIPIVWRMTDARMVGLSTWKVQKEAELVLTRSESLIEVRPPITNTEKVSFTKEINNSFGVAAAASLVFLVIGNLAIISEQSYIFAFSAALGSVICSLVSWVVAASIPLSCLHTSTFSLIAAIATLFALLGETDVDAGIFPTTWYHACTGLAALMMIIAILLAIF